MGRCGVKPQRLSYLPMVRIGKSMSNACLTSSITAARLHRVNSSFAPFVLGLARQPSAVSFVHGTRMGLRLKFQGLFAGPIGSSREGFEMATAEKSKSHL
jgi:hypothetical protein